MAAKPISGWSTAPTVKGTLRYISRDASASTRTFRVEVAIPNEDKTLPAGMTAEITLWSPPVDSVTLPRSVVSLSVEGDLGIRAVDKDNKVVFFPIDLIDDTTTGLVLGGIPADARIIVAGQELVTEGDVVNPVEADPETIKKLVKRRGGRDAVIMDIVKLAINNARLTISVLLFLMLAGCGRVRVDAEGSGTGRSDPDHVCQPDLSGHLA